MPVAHDLDVEEQQRVDDGTCACGCGRRRAPYGIWGSPSCRQRVYKSRKELGVSYSPGKGGGVIRKVTLSPTQLRTIKLQIPPGVSVNHYVRDAVVEAIRQGELPHAADDTRSWAAPPLGETALAEVCFRLSQEDLNTMDRIRGPVPRAIWMREAAMRRAEFARKQD